MRTGMTNAQKPALPGKHPARPVAPICSSWPERPIMRRAGEPAHLWLHSWVERLAP